MIGSLLGFGRHRPLPHSYVAACRATSGTGLSLFHGIEKVRQPHEGTRSRANS